MTDDSAGPERRADDSATRTDPPSGARGADDLAATMGGVDTLVMSSGTGWSTLLLDLDDEP